MKDVTIFQRANETVGMIVWENRDHPTPKEFAPDGAMVVCHTILPYCYIDWLKRMTRDKVEQLLKDIIKGGRKTDILSVDDFCGK